MTPPDYATWLTKQQAADAIGVTTKSVERFVQAGQIQQARWQRDGRGPLLAVYQPDDVARIAQERQPGPLPPFLVPGANGSNGSNGGPHRDPHEGLAHIESTPNLHGIQLGPGEDLFRALVSAARKVMSETSQTSAYVAKAEALALAGISDSELRKAVQAGEVKMRGRRYRRMDLEAL